MKFSPLEAVNYVLAKRIDVYFKTWQTLIAKTLKWIIYNSISHRDFNVKASDVPLLCVMNAKLSVPRSHSRADLTQTVKTIKKKAQHGGVGAIYYYTYI